MALRVRRRKAKGPKRVSYELLDPKSNVGEPIYARLRGLVKAHHAELIDARIAVAWCTSWRPDRDGRCILGKCVKASDLHRELAPFDFVILLKKSFWQDLAVSDLQREALLAHELMHATVTVDDRTGDPVTDERGRKVYRIRKHDLEEFSAIVERYGTWKKDIESFAAALNRSARGPWRPCASCQESPNPGYVDAGGGRLKRCDCWTSWRERSAEAMAS